MTLVLMPPREALYAALDARFDRMMAAGALDEVRRLLALDLDPALPAMKAVGVRELASHLQGACTLEQAIAAAKQGNAQLCQAAGNLASPSDDRSDSPRSAIFGKLEREISFQLFAKCY